MNLVYLQHIDHRFLAPLFKECISIGKSLPLSENIGAMLFGGGTDVNPELYGEKRGRYTDLPNIQRDTFEKKIFNRCVEAKIPMIGICRGAQFLTVMNGGKLIQNVDGHAGRSHNVAVITESGQEKILLTNSYHHQMMYPWSSKNKYKIIGKASPRISITYLGENNTVDTIPQCEPEIVFWPESNSLCIQSHPEWLGDIHEFHKYTIGLVSRFLDKKGEFKNV